MKTYKQVAVSEIQAVQYGTDEQANSLVKLCKKRYGEIKELPSDLLGTPEDAFNAVKTNSGWVKIKKSDWIVQKESDLFVISNSIFQLFFKEV